MQTLHSAAVENAITAYTPRVWPSDQPDRHPTIADEEKRLGRTARTTLAQLRSGYSKSLNNFMARIDNTYVDVCPKCQGTPHNTHHLFNCPSNPVAVDVEDLWLNPVAVAASLDLETVE